MLRNVSLIGGSVIGAQNALAINRARTINGIGDSIVAQPRYMPSNLPSYFAAMGITIPAWTANTTYGTVGTIVQNNSGIYRLTTAGTSASSGGPLTYTTGITDGSCVWNYLSSYSERYGTSFLVWAERLSLGALRFEQAQGYGGTLNGVFGLKIQAGGSGYVTPVLTLSNGATATVTQTNGVITGATITNPGYAYSGSISVAVTDSGGSGTGGIITVQQTPSGTFGVPGAHTIDAIQALPDAVASSVDIFVYHCGTNDVAGNKTAATITANDKIIIETLVSAGKNVIVTPILPRHTMTAAQAQVATRVNRWRRAYCNKETWANPLGVNVAWADPTSYFVDNTSTGSGNTWYEPIGGAGGVANAMTQDGVHPSPRGAMYMGLEIIKAAKKFYGETPDIPSTSVSFSDGYEPTYNPTGNILEGYPWVASTAYSVVGQYIQNDSGKIYRLTTAGTSASSGGPTGTGSGITDGTCVWNYVRPQGACVFGSGTTGTYTSPGGSTSITQSGNIATGYTLSRTAGGASTAGTITCAIDNPQNNGQVGTAQSLSFSLGGGATNEAWRLIIMNGALPFAGINVANDAGISTVYAEAIVQVSGAANLTYIMLDGGSDSGTQCINRDGNAVSTAQGNQMMASNGEMLPYPNNGLLYLRSRRMLLPTTYSAIGLALYFGFDTSGAAGSATGTIKIKHLAFRKTGIL